MPHPFRVVAIIAAYNEEDILGQALAHLAEQGASAYLLDDGSTDRTVDLARGFLDRGLLAVESLRGLGREGQDGRFSLSRILSRKEELAEDLDADWFINHDADEFRDSPWPHLSLCEAIALVDRLGWNAIDFEVLNFMPAGGTFRPGDDPGSVFQRYEPRAEHDRLQVCCWKKKTGRVDLVSTAGHDVQFPDRRVFPIRFPMRHYPIRSAAHGERKVFRERKPRFDPEERARGWHVQYERFIEGGSFVRDPDSLVVYDRDAVNLSVQIQNRIVEILCPPSATSVRVGPVESVQRIEGEITRQRTEAEALRVAHDRALAESQRLQRDLANRAEEAQQLLLLLEQRVQDLQAHRAARDESERQLREALATAVQARHEALVSQMTLDDITAELKREATSVAWRLDEVLASRSWRITAPLRAVWRLLGGK